MPPKKKTKRTDGGVLKTAAIPPPSQTHPETRTPVAPLR